MCCCTVKRSDRNNHQRGGIMVNLEQRRNRHITGIMIPVQLAISEPFRLEICYLIFFFNTCLNLKKCHKSALFFALL